MTEVTRDDLAAALDGFYLSVRNHRGYQESGQVAHPDQVADALHATLSRIAAERSPDQAAAADDPYVRETGRLADDVGREVIFGVDYDSVTLRADEPVALGQGQQEELGQLIVAAVWQAAWQRRQMDADTDALSAAAGAS